MATEGSVPVPDPSVLTTQNLQRELGASKEYMEARLAGIEKVSGLLADDVSRVHDRIGTDIGHLKELIEEKFRGVQRQFDAIRELSDKLAEATSKAVDAALQAAKEAVGKQQDNNTARITEMTGAFTKQADSLGASMKTSFDAADSKITDVKDLFNRVEARVVAIESRGTGKSEGLSQVGALILGIFTGLAVLVSVATLIFEVAHK